MSESVKSVSSKQQTALQQFESLSTLDSTGLVILQDIMKNIVHSDSDTADNEVDTSDSVPVTGNSRSGRVKPSAINYETTGCVGKEGVSGVCYSTSECYTRGGHNVGTHCVGGLVCCIFEYHCGDSTSESVGNFRSSDYPMLSVGSRACDFDIVIQNTVCAVRVDFVKTILAKKLGGVCDIDQFVILNSIDGPTVAQCGDLSGYSTTVAVMPAQHKPLKLALVVQNEGYYIWDIRITQLKCSDLNHFYKPPVCGKHESTMYNMEQEWNDDQWQNNIDNTYNNIWWNFPEPVFNTFYYGSSKRSMRNSKLSHPAQDRVIKGSDAAQHEFPWQVAIFINKMFFCGGSVINHEFVLTAAHCFLTRDTPAAELILYIGDHDLTNNTEAYHEIRTVRNIYYHSHFHPFVLANDIALLRLNEPVAFTHRVQPVCLPYPGDNYIGRKSTVVGWGITSFPNGQPSKVLQKLDVQVISNVRCSRVIEEAVTAGMLCASPQGLQGTCFGDSGGPLTLNENGKEILIGIVSFGVTGCAVLPGFPDLYTRVSEYLRWIDANAVPTR